MVINNEYLIRPILSRLSEKLTTNEITKRKKYKTRIERPTPGPKYFIF